MNALASRHLGTLTMRIAASYEVGDGPHGRRRIDVLDDGRFDGERLSARLVTGSDAILFRRDGVAQPDVRLLLRTDDDAFVHIRYRGIRHGPPEAMERIARGLPVDPASYYLRTSLIFETGDARYDWLNRMLAVGVGRREPGSVAYEVFEIL